jgi:DNA invertase Pin-like site-specific DNA recombinase
MRFGYARVSSTGQSLDIQVAALNGIACERIMQEKRSGTSMTERTELNALLSFVRRGDEVWITRLDRLARSLSDLLKIVEHLEKVGASLHCIEQPIETKGPTGRLMLAILGAFAAFETELRKERQAEGILAARASGAYQEHKRGPSYDRKVIASMKFDRGMKTAHIAKELGCAEYTVRRALKEWQAGQAGAE